VAAYTEDQLASLDRAIAEGALIAQYRDKRVEYRSLNEMLRIRAMIAGELAGLSSSGAGTRRYFSFRRD
jgi:hypothetical protein